MSTLGEKVTTTIIDAVSKGAEGFALKDKGVLKAIIGPQVEDALARVPPGSPFRRELEHMQSDSVFWDVFTMTIGLITGAVQSLLAAGTPWVEMTKQGAFETRPSMLAPPPVLEQARLQSGGDTGLIDKALQKQGYDEKQRQMWHRSFERPLSDPDIRDAALRGLLGSQGAESWLAKHGYTPEAIQAITELYWRLPPVQDVIRMAVREVFTPEIAAKFGQYQDLPGEFVALAAKIGLSAEVAKWYWAAHWELPSAGQGFEMLHRGVISDGELDLLLRAQDVMPFWRERLKSIAYSPLTRVDIRRMYHLGVLTEAQVASAYKAIGYNDENAALLLEFTKQYYGPEDEDAEEGDRELTKSEVLTGYRKGAISAAQAKEALMALNYSEDKVAFYLALEDLKAAQEIKDAYQTAFKALYVEGLLSASEVTQRMATLGFSSSELDTLLSLWYLDRVRKAARPSRTDITRFAKAGIISVSQWRQEMAELGYSEQYVSWYEADLESE